MPKIIIFSVLIKIFVFNFSEFFSIYEPFLLFCCLSSIVIGSLSAIYQKKIKRLFAYSTISHSGFILLGLLNNSAESSKAVIFYVFVYVLLTLLTFCFLIFSTTATTNNPKYLAN